MSELSSLLDILRRLNQLQRNPQSESMETLSPDEVSQAVEDLRKKLPTSLLGHHDRMIARGRPSLTLVRNGVCGACHLHLPRGHHRATSGPQQELDLCDHCGVFLERPTEAIPAAEPGDKPAKPKRRTAKRKLVAA